MQRKECASRYDSLNCTIRKKKKKRPQKFLQEWLNSSKHSSCQYFVCKPAQPFTKPPNATALHTQKAHISVVTIIKTLQYIFCQTNSQREEFSLLLFAGFMQCFFFSRSQGAVLQSPRGFKPMWRITTFFFFKPKGNSIHLNLINSAFNSWYCVLKKQSESRFV